tara:strand:- start:929 stop:1408 length:480 start_codon:yes stop_codon:yes gene_type:complete
MKNIDEEYRKRLRLEVENKPTIKISDIGKYNREKIGPKYSDKKDPQDLVGTIVANKKRNFGKVIKVITTTKGCSSISYAYTDKKYKLKVNDIYKMMRIQKNEVSRKNYPQGSEFSHRVLNAPKIKGKGGHALKGKHEVDDKSISYYRKHYKNKGGFYSE